MYTIFRHVGSGFLSFFIHHGLIGLFGIGIISSIIPIPTEPVIFAVLMRSNPHIVITVLIISSMIGAIIGYYIGKYELRKILPFHNMEKEKQLQDWFRKHGALVLLMSPWIPIVGDLAPLVAGIEKYEFKRFIIFILIAKIIKSFIIVYAMAYLSIEIIKLIKVI